MNAVRAHRELLYYLIDVYGFLDQPWSHVWALFNYSNDFWKLSVRPTPTASNVGLVDMSSENIENITTVYTQTYKYVDNILTWDVDQGEQDLRTADRLSLDHHGVGEDAPYKLALQDVEFVDAPVELETHLEIITKDGFTTNGTLASITMNVGHQEMTFTGAARDSTIFMGAGYDKIDFVDDLDVPGEQFWSVVRRADGELDVYSLFSGYRVRLADGYKAWTPVESNLMNYGEVEEISFKNARTGSTEVYRPGVDVPDGGQRGTQSNIDLRGDGVLFSDSFNLAYFNFIRYTSQNVWSGEATIHDGNRYSAPSDRTVTEEKYGVDATTLSGTLSVIGQSRNGTHDLIVGEQAPGAAIDGKLRLYAFDVQSGMYNSFNEVFLGSAASEASDKSYISGTNWQDRVALYGFGGNDALHGGAGRDYIFGGQSVYSQLNASDLGNIVTGGDGADYFGVGHTDTSGVTSGANSIRAGNFLQGYATDVIMDWDAGTDTLVVLSNGVAVIGGLYGVAGMSGDDTIDLRATSAVATSDQDFDGARGGDASKLWDANADLAYVFDNQQLRDNNSISNEGDVTVVNEGVIVSRGLGGNDTIWGSSGVDYVYGGSGKNYLYLGHDASIDRAFVDQFIGRQIVRQFDNNEDKIYLNVDAILDAQARIVGINPHLGINWSDPYSANWVKNSSSTAFSFGQPSSVSLDLGEVGIIYYPWTQTYLGQLNTIYPSSNGAWRNLNHQLADFTADVALGVAGGALVLAGSPLLFNPFSFSVGISMMATGGSQIAAALTTAPHLNAVYETDHHLGEYYINYLSAARTVSTTTGHDDTPLFTSFFWDPSVSTSFAKAVEFKSTLVNDFSGITTYAVLNSNTETFIYFIQSDDHIVTDDETRLVAEIESIVPISDLAGYKGDLDIYNQNGVVQPVYPQAISLACLVDGGVSVSDRIKAESVTLIIELAGSPSAGDTIDVFNGDTKLATLATVPGVSSYSVTHALETPASGIERLLSYRAVSKSSQDFTTSSETISLIHDNQAPEIIAVTPSGDNQISVIVNGNDISVGDAFAAPSVPSEVAHVKLMQGDTAIASNVVDEAFGTAALSVPPSVFVPQTYTVEVSDQRGNIAVDDTRIYALTNGGDTFVASAVSAITLGLSGDDNIMGTNSSDIISGGAGDDVIAGLGGVDVLIGGSGADTFTYSVASDSTPADYDRITDFVSGSDKLDLSGALASTNSMVVDLGRFDGDEAFDQGVAASDRAMDLAGGRVIFFFDNGTDGFLVMNAGMSGPFVDATPDMIIELSGITSAPLSTDFIL